MKLLAILFVILTGPAASAEGTCTSQAGKGAHEGFCNSQSEHTCSTHSALCTWEKAKVKNLKIISKAGTENIKVIETVEHSCVAKAGMSAHASFCKSQNKMACEVHSVCTWE